MPNALCIHCGTFKNTPVETCPQCSHTPAAGEDLARHTLLAKPYFTDEQLQIAARQIQDGVQLEFDEYQVAALSDLRTSNEFRDRRIFGFSMMLSTLILIVLAIALFKVFFPLWIK